MLTTCGSSLNLNLLHSCSSSSSAPPSISVSCCVSHFHTTIHAHPLSSLVPAISAHVCLSLEVSALPARTRELLRNTCYTMWSASYRFQGSCLWGARLFHGIPSSLGVIEGCGNPSRASGFCLQCVCVARWAYVWRPGMVRGPLEVEKQKHKCPLSPLL